jgi:hypothetical protein
MSETCGTQAVTAGHDGKYSCKRHRLFVVLPIVVLAGAVPGTIGAFRQDTYEDSVAARTWAELIPVDNGAMPATGSEEEALVSLVKMFARLPHPPAWIV